MMILIPKGKKSAIHTLIDCLSVFVTDKEYNDPDFENEQCLYEEVEGASSIDIAAAAKYAQAVVDLGDGNSLWIQSDKNVGL